MKDFSEGLIVMERSIREENSVQAFKTFRDLVKQSHFIIRKAGIPYSTRKKVIDEAISRKLICSKKWPKMLLLSSKSIKEGKLEFAKIKEEYSDELWKLLI